MGTIQRESAGKTALCGCNSPNCDKDCIRKDSRLKYRDNLSVKGLCGYYLKGDPDEPRNND